jgi:hypothetical protein
MAEWIRVMKGMHKANDGLRKSFRSTLRKDLMKVKKTQADIAGDLPHFPSELRAVMKRPSTMQLEVREKPSKARTSNKPFSLIRIRLRSSQLATLHGGVGSQTWPNPHALLGMAKRSSEGKWRHMAFGNRNSWYSQKTTKGWYDKAFKDAEPKIMADVNKQLHEWSKTFDFRRFGA